jgi:cysteine synthase A
MGAGTGGTLAGVANYLKSQLKNVQIILADPEGSGIFNKVKYNIMYSSTEAEGTRRRHQVDTIVEGIGLNRITRNFSQMSTGTVDDAIKVTDKEAVEMSRWLLRKDGMLYSFSPSDRQITTFI